MKSEIYTRFARDTFYFIDPKTPLVFRGIAVLCTVRKEGATCLICEKKIRADHVFGIGVAVPAPSLSWLSGAGLRGTSSSAGTRAVSLLSRICVLLTLSLALASPKCCLCLWACQKVSGLNPDQLLSVSVPFVPAVPKPPHFTKASTSLLTHP